MFGAGFGGYLGAVRKGLYGLRGLGEIEGYMKHLCKRCMYYVVRSTRAVSAAAANTDGYSECDSE